MAELVLGPMLRHVGETSATVWVETDAPCAVSVLDATTHTFTVAGHHFALVMIDGLERGASYEYTVELDGTARWPLDGELPASRIRTVDPSADARVVFGSCRSAAPHEPPWSLELSLDPKGRGVDALYAYTLAMVDAPQSSWPHLAIFLGDQIYADEASPRTRERVAARRASGTGSDVESSLPAMLVEGFEEFTWLYQEAWSPRIERWFFANVPSVMIFDDHDMIDDWNISRAWVDGIRDEPWWREHVIGGLMTYWIYQHLGNLAPQQIRADGLLDALLSAEDGTEVLRDWAEAVEGRPPTADRERFDVVRDLGRVRLVLVDVRNGRVLDDERRRLIDPAEWEWVVDACSADVDHLLIGSSLPAFVPGGLHDLQTWSEVVSDTRRSGVVAGPGRRVGEWLRVKADMEDWPSFSRSFDDLVELLTTIGASSRAAAPATISVLSGDIHFSYAAQVHFPGTQMSSRVHQLVNSPIRNALNGPERTAMRLGMSSFAEVLGRIMRRSVGRRRCPLRWAVDEGPVFDNCLGEITFSGRKAALLVQHTLPYATESPAVLEPVIEVDLDVGAGPQSRRRRAARIRRDTLRRTQRRVTRRWA